MRSYCNKHDETVQHFFSTCNEVISLWTEIKVYFVNDIKLIALCPQIVILGYTNTDDRWNTSTRFISLKLCVGFSIFDFVSFLLKFDFFSTKSTDFLTLKRHNSFNNLAQLLCVCIVIRMMKLYSTFSAHATRLFHYGQKSKFIL